jgi:DNA-binding SARP family transcriptional activator
VRSARASLRSAIWALRSAFGAEFGSYLAAGRDTVTVAGEDLWVDLREFRRLAGCGQLEAALALCRGDLLQELDDDWVIEARGEFELDLVSALKDLTDQASAVGDSAAALGLGAAPGVVAAAGRIRRSGPHQGSHRRR